MLYNPAMQTTPPGPDVLPPQRFPRPLTTSGLWAVAFTLTAIAASEALLRLRLAPPLQFLVALAPVVPALLCGRAWRRASEGLDELQRRIVLDGLAFTFPGLLVLFVTADLFRKAGYLPGFAWSTFSLSVAMLALYVTGSFWSARRYH